MKKGRKKKNLPALGVYHHCFAIKQETERNSVMVETFVHQLHQADSLQERLK